MAGSKIDEKHMKWWQLSLFGVGCTIGTGFFLGSSIGIGQGGPSIVIAYVLAGITTYIVFDALAKLTASHPEKGAFRSYAKQAYGPWAGFSIGWMYWFAEILIMGSQLTALSIFSRFWFPNIPLWLFAIGYAILGLFVLLVGAKKLTSIENIFAVIKLAAILMFIIGIVRGDPDDKPSPPKTEQSAKSNAKSAKKNVEKSDTGEKGEKKNYIYPVAWTSFFRLDSRDFGQV